MKLNFRKLQDRLQYHGVDYHAAAAAASNYADVTDFNCEKVRKDGVVYNYFSKTWNYLNRQKAQSKHAPSTSGRKGINQLNSIKPLLLILCTLSARLLQILNLMLIYLHHFQLRIILYDLPVVFFFIQLIHVYQFSKEWRQSYK